MISAFYSLHLSFSSAQPSTSPWDHHRNTDLQFRWNDAPASHYNYLHGLVKALITLPKNWTFHLSLWYWDFFLFWLFSFDVSTHGQLVFFLSYTSPPLVWLFLPNPHRSVHHGTHSLSIYGVLLLLSLFCPLPPLVVSLLVRAHPRSSWTMHTSDESFSPWFLSRLIMARKYT